MWPQNPECHNHKTRNIDVSLALATSMRLYIDFSSWDVGGGGTFLVFVWLERGGRLSQITMGKPKSLWTEWEMDFVINHKSHNRSGKIPLCISSVCNFRDLCHRKSNNLEIVIVPQWPPICCSDRRYLDAARPCVHKAIYYSKVHVIIGIVLTAFH